MATNLTSNVTTDGFASETERLRDAGVAGKTGRLRELFDYFAERGADSVPATQAEIAEAVFGQTETHSDDATVRVYVHRLRKKLDDHYLANPPVDGQAMLEIPAGIYVLRLVEQHVESPAVSNSPPPRTGIMKYWPVLGVFALLAAFLAGYVLQGAGSRSANAIWQPVVDSDRPVLIVLGDYYIYGEIDPVRPEEGRLIRDFRVNSAQDLLLMQDLEPDRFGNAEDVGLNYLPMSSSYALAEILPLLTRDGRTINTIPASELVPDMLNDFDVVYVGLLSGMALLEQQVFTGSGFRLGESYDELADRVTGQTYTSEEARSLASPAFYRDFAYVARFNAAGGGQVVVIASQRDTGLRGISPIVTAPDLPNDLAQAAGGEAFEALFQITGQQGADLNDRLLVARSRE